MPGSRSAHVVATGDRRLRWTGAGVALAFGVSALAWWLWPRPPLPAAAALPRPVAVEQASAALRSGAAGPVAPGAVTAADAAVAPVAGSAAPGDLGAARRLIVNARPATPPGSGAAAPSPVAAAPAPPGAVAAPPPVKTLSTAELLAGNSHDWRAARLHENPAVLVIEFPSLAEQGAAMNRLAALLEKAGAPRDRVLGDAELAALIARAGDNAQTFYQGHDYDGFGLARFFALVAQQRQPLNAAERRLRALLVAAEVLDESPAGLQPRGVQAIITFTATQADDPATPVDETVDERRRDSVLRHELSHGLYFTQPAYREHCRRFWHEALTEAQREALRRYLAGIGYDRSNEELMLNEAQAFLAHTRDTRAFNAAVVGLPEATLAGLRARFLKTMPAIAAR